MSGWPISPQAHRPQRQQHQASFMSNYSNSPLSRSTVDLSDVTHEYEPDVDADGYRRLGHLNPEDSHIGLLSGSHTSSRSDHRTGRPTSKHGEAMRQGSRSKSNKRHDFTSERPESFTFEHEPDADADGYRHHHGNLSSPALRALPEGTVPLDPRAGRVIITPSPSLRPHHSPYKHIDGFPTKSIEDLRDPEELHSHADMIYGIDESKARDYSVPQWMEAESSRLIEEASHGAVTPRDDPKAAPAVPSQRPIKATGETFAPTGQARGDREPVGPTRPMRDDERAGIKGAYTQDGEGSAGLPFDENSKAPAKEGDITVQEDETPVSMSDSVETVRARRPSAVFAALRRPEHKGIDPIQPVEDFKQPEQEQGGDIKDERPDWLRAAELMANNDWERLEKEKLVEKSTLEEEEQRARDRGSAAHKARAALLQSDKYTRGSSYPSFAEAEQASHVNTPAEELEESPLDKQPATAGKFLGLSSVAAAGATLPIAATMTDSRDVKAREEVGGESTSAQAAVPAPKIPARPAKKEASDAAAPAIPTRPVKSQSKETTEETPASSQPIGNREPSMESPQVPARPQSKGTTQDVGADAPKVPARPQKQGSISREFEPAPKPAVPARPVPGKLAGTSKFAFASALEAKLKAGAPAIGLKKQVSHDQERAAVSQDEVMPQASTEKEPATATGLADARKGRPVRRRAAAAPTSTTDTQSGLDSMAPPPVCETGETFISRFGVEMRSMCVQTGVIRIDSPSMNLTVMSSAGRHGEDVVVQAKTKSEAETLEPATNAAAPKTEADEREKSKVVDSLTVPSVSLEEAAGGEVRSLEKNDLHAEAGTSAAQPAQTSSAEKKHEKHQFSDEKPVTDEDEKTSEMKLHAMEDELEV
ncbi:hypothetical protein BCR37DRAFT_375927 [Protomyces lactucae-debilis]|uniref:Altered inheritance of mitochondria protein 21 n=1 Tax=Protomyces lactucae-debilis TaxID=2754530 RepID=A0A1Y2FXQ9_PROLT|nr:uncharacterized protein BCR37DRAFT_375927 [Protomyces lactucae-debilis]ORY87956.1 hypothetical protein BCR37DRAFT_375927 [Protomyces lactucae-debilis]